MQITFSYSDAEAVRRVVSEHFPKVTITDREWSFIRSTGAVDRVLEDSSTINDLFTLVNKYLESTRRPSERGTPKTSTADETKKQELISLYAAQEADRDPDVVSFRREVLGDHVLDRAEVEAWINSRSKKDGPSTPWLYCDDLALPAGSNVTIDADGVHISPAVEISGKGFGTKWHMLSYAVASDPWGRSVPTFKGGVLERLRRLSEKLHDHYDWSELYASMFILTGQIPFMQAATIQFIGGLPPKPFKRRVVQLTIDPSISPAELARKYSVYRRTIMAAHRVRDLSEKHLRLAEFTNERPNGESGRSRFKRWNKTYPKWKYKQENNFRRDAGKAKERILALPVEDYMKAMWPITQTNVSAGRERVKSTRGGQQHGK